MLWLLKKQRKFKFLCQIEKVDNKNLFLLYITEQIKTPIRKCYLWHYVLLLLTLFRFKSFGEISNIFLVSESKKAKLSNIVELTLNVKKCFALLWASKSKMKLQKNSFFNSSFEYLAKNCVKNWSRAVDFSPESEGEKFLHRVIFVPFPLHAQAIDQSFC